jgi:geranylgeranyl diphosphate synthase, type II
VNELVSDFDLQEWAGRRRAEVDALMEERLPQPQRHHDPGRLVESIRYSLLAPGKRLRPLLALAAAEAVTSAEVTPSVRLAAASVELVHCYSLIHDDLPAMDDDDLRRGKPTSHKVFGEAGAILAGDALLTLAFDWIAEAGLTARAAGNGGDYLRAAAALAKGAGMWGMVRGQARDLGEPVPASLAEVEQLHREKTGALFRAAVEVGGAAAGASDDQLAALGRFADGYGLAFQHADDLDDAEHGDFAAEARRRVSALAEEAAAALTGWDNRADPLRGLARALGERAQPAVQAQPTDDAHTRTTPVRPMKTVQ